jgi:hypothetical protein
LDPFQCCYPCRATKRWRKNPQVSIGGQFI